MDSRLNLLSTILAVLALFGCPGAGVAQERHSVTPVISADISGAAATVSLAAEQNPPIHLPLTGAIAGKVKLAGIELAESLSWDGSSADAIRLATTATAHGQHPGINVSPDWNDPLYLWSLSGVDGNWIPGIFIGYVGSGWNGAGKDFWDSGLGDRVFLHVQLVTPDQVLIELHSIASPFEWWLESEAIYDSMPLRRLGESPLSLQFDGDRVRGLIGDEPLKGRGTDGDGWVVYLGDGSDRRPSAPLVDVRRWITLAPSENIGDSEVVIAPEPKPADARIVFSLDSQSGEMAYAGPFTIFQSTTVRAHTTRTGFIASDEAVLAVQLDRPAAIPGSSIASPVFIEGRHGHADASAASATLQGPGGGIAGTFFARDRFYANYPLDPAAETQLALDLSRLGIVESRAVTWTPTLLSGSQAIDIRVGDALLFQADVSGTWSIRVSSGFVHQDEPINAGEKIPHTFSEPGQYQVTAKNAEGGEVANIAVTVVSVELQTRIISEVGFQRTIEVPIQPSGAKVVFTANDPSVMRIDAVNAAMNPVEVTLTALDRGMPAAVARLGSATGPIISARTVDEFTFNTGALFSSVVNADSGIGTSTLVMRPYIPDHWFEFEMFASSTTFKGGERKFDINTSAPSSTNGEGPFVQEFDPATCETIGLFSYDLEMPASETSYCFLLNGSQRNSPWELTSCYYNINGDVCHVSAFNSLVFTNNIPAQEDEVHPIDSHDSAVNPEFWTTRKWPLFTFSSCGQGSSCSVQFHLRVSPPSPRSSTRIDNPVQAFFGGTLDRFTSDCATCGGCKPMTPVMDTGTIPARYATTVEACSLGTGDVLASATGGIFHVSKLDAHGVGSEQEKFPDYAECIAKRRGTVFDPVIQIDRGGVRFEENEVSLYGIGDEECMNPCDSRILNKWTFKAVAKDPQTLVNIPSGYFIRWRLSNFDYSQGSSVAMPHVELDSGEETVEPCFGPGRWYPRLEVWRTIDDDGDPIDAPELVSVAEIHSLAVELVETNNVPVDSSTVPSDQLRGRRFQVSNHAAGINVDSRIGIIGGGSDGDPELTVRGRVSLNGYPQNQYWVKEGDDYDLPQVVQIPDEIPQTFFLQGYQLNSLVYEDLTLQLEGQAFLEACSACPARQFLGKPVTPEWQETDREKFNAYAIEWREVTEDSGETDRTNRIKVSNPSPVIAVESFNVSVDQSGSAGSIDAAVQTFSGTISASGTITSRLCDFIEGDQGTVDRVTVQNNYAGPVLTDASVSVSKSGDGTLPRPFPYSGQYSFSVTVPDLQWGDNKILLTVEDKFFGAQTTQEMFFSIEPADVTTPPSEGPLRTLPRFSQSIRAELDLRDLESLDDLAPTIGTEPVALTTWQLPSGIGRFAVGDASGAKVRVFSTNGQRLGTFTVPGVVRLADLDFQSSFNRFVVIDDASRLAVAVDAAGTELAQGPLPPFDGFDRVASLPDGRAMVANDFNKLLVLLDPDLQVLSTRSFEAVPFAFTPGLALGDPDTVPGDLVQPSGAAYSPFGELYVADRDNDRILRFDLSGNFERVLFGESPGSDDLSAPAGIAVDADGSLIVVDAGHARLLRLDAEGILLGAMGESIGLSDPAAVALSSAGEIAIADAGNDRIVVLSSSGALVRTFGTTGSEPGQLSDPRGVAVAADGTYFVADSGNNRVQRFDGAGDFMAIVLPSGSASGEVLEPTSISSIGNRLVIGDTGNDRIQIFDLTHGIASGIVSPSAALNLQSPAVVAVRSDALGEIAVADPTSNRVFVLNRDSRDARGIVVDAVAGVGFQVYSNESGVLYRFDASLAPLGSIALSGIAPTDTVRDLQILNPLRTSLLITSEVSGPARWQTDNPITGGVVSSFPLLAQEIDTGGAIRAKVIDTRVFVLNPDDGQVSVHNFAGAQVRTPIGAEGSTLPFSLQSLVDPGLAPITTALSGISSENPLQLHAVDQPVFVTVSREDLASVLVQPTGEARIISAMLDVSAWGLQQNVALRESAPGSRLFQTTVLSVELNVIAANVLNAVISSEGEELVSGVFASSADDPLRFDADGGTASLRLSRSDFSASEADALTVFVSIPAVQLSEHPVDIVESSADSTAFSSSAVQIPPQQSSELRFTISAPRRVISYNEELFQPMAIRVNGIFTDSEVETLRVRLPSDIERPIIHHEPDDKYYIADEERTRVSTNLFIGNRTWGTE